MIMQKPSKIQGIEPRVMNFRESTILYPMDWPAENGFRDRELAGQPPPPSAKPAKIYDVRLIVAVQLTSCKQAVKRTIKV